MLYWFQLNDQFLQVHKSIDAQVELKILELTLAQIA